MTPEASEAPEVNVAQTAEVNDWSDCPYIGPGWLEETNGQRLTKQGIDTRFPTPACVFWSYQDEPQATVIVRDMPTVEDARAAVDDEPVSSDEVFSSPSALPSDFVGSCFLGFVRITALMCTLAKCIIASICRGPGVRRNTMCNPSSCDSSG